MTSARILPGVIKENVVSQNGQTWSNEGGEEEKEEEEKQETKEPEEEEQKDVDLVLEDLE